MRPDDIQDTYKDPPLLRQWFLVMGQPQCPFNAVESWAISSEQRQTILDRNQSVRETLTAVLDYEEALRISQGEQPPATIMQMVDVADPETGEITQQEQEVVNPEALVWAAASELVSSAPQELKDLASKRAGTWEGEAESVPVNDFEDLQPVPCEITPRQGELTLISAGLYDEVMGIVDQLPPLQQVAFRRAQTWRREDPMFNQLGGMLSTPLNHEQINNLFRQAGQIT